ncbi:MAG: ABC transporter ATP-binding protein, partial [Solirubrobacteraceae bacterium]
RRRAIDVSGSRTAPCPAGRAADGASSLVVARGLDGARSAPSPGGADDGARTLCFALARRLGSFSLKLEHDASAATLAILGPSGAGKTLTLRLIAGLLDGEPRTEVRLGDRRLDRLPPERRGFGYVPQHAALLPRRTVWAQVNFGVRADPALAAEWLWRLGLDGLEDRYPQELSGGQQRRVALARALATAPRALLLDEPFTGLDAPVRDRLRRDLRRLQRETRLTTVIVTHDAEEAALLADELLVIDDGRLLQAGARSEVFRAPRSPQVAALLGLANTREGVVLAPGLIDAGGVQLSAPTGEIPAGAAVIWSVRPERIALLTGGASGGAVHEAVHEATLLDDVDLGAVRELTVGFAGGLELTMRTAEEAPLAVGERVRIALPPGGISVWSASGSEREGYQTVLTP